MEKLDIINKKIRTPVQLSHLLNIWRFLGKKIVFTNGCFDLVHLGHVDYLAKAASMGDRLVIGLNSDSSTSTLKGPNRPITDQHSRASILASMFFVDAVILFDEQTPYNLIRSVMPDVLVKGADYSVEQIVGSDIVLANGGEVKTVQYIDGYSTSAIERKIKNS